MEFVVDGKRVFAATGGRAFVPGARAVVLVHGAGLDRSVWTLQARYLAHHRFAVLAPDLPGHGRSEGPPLGSVAALGAWLLRLMDVAGLKRAALVGHSMGSLAALAAAALAPERVAALALLGTAFPMAVSEGLLAAARADDPKAFGMIVGWGHSRTAHLGRSPVPGLWMVGSSFRLLERSPPGTLAADLAAVNAYRDGLADAAKVACPTLVLLGDSDRMTPVKSGRALAQAIRGATTVVLEDCGHLMMAERPDAVTDALKQHLNALA